MNDESERCGRKHSWSVSRFYLGICLEGNSEERQYGEPTSWTGLDFDLPDTKHKCATLSAQLGTFYTSLFMKFTLDLGNHQLYIPMTIRKLLYR